MKGLASCGSIHLDLLLLFASFISHTSILIFVHRRIISQYVRHSMLLIEVHLIQEWCMPTHELTSWPCGGPLIGMMLLIVSLLMIEGALECLLNTGESLLKEAKYSAAAPWLLFFLSINRIIILIFLCLFSTIIIIVLILIHKPLILESTRGDYSIMLFNA